MDSVTYDAIVRGLRGVLCGVPRGKREGRRMLDLVCTCGKTFANWTSAASSTPPDAPCSCCGAPHNWPEPLPDV